MSLILTAVALTIAGLTLAATLWSVAKPDRRIWPPQTFGPAALFIGWGGTFTFSAAVVALGILGWGEAQVPVWLRYFIGPILILVGNAGAWFEVIGFGANQTMGAEGQLKINGLYRYSRNPQYFSDIAILIGWALLSASIVALPAIIAGIAVFIAFPFAEEGWLKERYGAAYLKYKAKVRRFL
ncbi:heavy metal resistance protein CzcN [Thioclava dalianensis]|uniref:Heavy metal resistance protein CzcN n=1 Tax=Thioclava dalianensis TaxID=1185766 RepID=A0A074T8T5_9RHOB|nr:isoprenylcysteine carboxylmethyltransferase family protein [Thioclava dalianensis]KEP68134.1 heavy metal resistance protein CzcN [Thioclava dalianensis]